MDIDAIPLFSMLKDRLSYVSQRERLIAQNVANADTPGYAPKDLKPFTVNLGGGAGGAGGSLAMMQPAVTNPAHLTGSAGAAGGSSGNQWKTVTTEDSETTLDGNKVELEDEMTKMTESRMDYDAVIGFYQKSMEMLRTAARAPGK